MTSALPDAAPGNWVDRLAPPPLRPWLRLARLDRPTGIWLLMLPGWEGIALADATMRRLPDLRLLALFFAGALLMRSAGCAYNDVVDRDLDAKVARTAGRPVASGQIGVKAALVFVALCCLASLAILLSLNPISIALGVASLALVAAYPFMKRITWWPQAWLGLTFNWGALLGFTAIAPPAALAAWTPALLLYAGGVAWTLGYDTIYAVQDLEDDALAGVKSSARRLGAATRAAVASFYLVAIALALAAGWQARLGVAFWALAVVYAAWLLRQPAMLRLDDPARALAVFQSNTLAALLLFIAIAAGAASTQVLPP
ncbi:MAG TPA: 4-hydroxybenzoate octaprenyltransferase [Caulobacteraceae bacterium]|jgi:4-hydroxybenzoate polyprenyltransferase